MRSFIMASSALQWLQWFIYNGFFSTPMHIIIIVLFVFHCKMHIHCSQFTDKMATMLSSKKQGCAVFIIIIYIMVVCSVVTLEPSDQRLMKKERYSARLNFIKPYPVHSINGQKNSQIQDILEVTIKWKNPS